MFPEVCRNWHLFGADICSSLRRADDLNLVLQLEVRARRERQQLCARAPRVVPAVMIAASLDWAAMTIAAALVTEEEAVPHNGPGLMRFTTVMRP